MSGELVRLLVSRREYRRIGHEDVIVRFAGRRELRNRHHAHFRPLPSQVAPHKDLQSFTFTGPRLRICIERHVLVESD